MTDLKMEAEIIFESHVPHALRRAQEYAGGARVLTGGKCEGRCYQPTVLDNVPGDCRISKKEVFGPVVALYPFREIQEAIELANDVDYGLQAGVFTRSLATAHHIADALDCGGVMINDSSDYRIDAMPFGGTRGSGLGREGVDTPSTK